MDYFLTAFISGMVGIVIGVLWEHWDARQPHRVEAEARQLLRLSMKQIMKENRK